MLQLLLAAADVPHHTVSDRVDALQQQHTAASKQAGGASLSNEKERESTTRIRQILRT
jgi:hypothetical protein